MDCDDARFTLRFRRPGPDELGPDAVADLDRHLAGCPRCSAVARRSAGFDAAVGSAMRGVSVPVGLRSKLIADLSARRGAVLRRKAYQLAAVAASALLAVGLAVGVFTASRPVVDSELLARANDDLADPTTAEARVRDWLRAEGLPPALPEAFDYRLLITYGTEPVEGRNVPVVTFRDPTGTGFAKVYAVRSTQFKTDGLRDAQASLCQAKVYDTDRATGVTFVVVYTGPSLAPFLRGGPDA